MSGKDNIHKHQPGTDNFLLDHELHELIRGCIAENQLSQKKLYDKYAPLMYAVVKRYIYDEHHAREVLNDAFYKVITRIGQYSFRGELGAWIRRIVINTIMDRTRKDMRHKEHRGIELDTDDTTVEEEVIHKMSFNELLVCIHDLPPVHRTVFNMYVFDDFSHKDISAQLRINEANCRWYLKDARKRLKEKIKHMQ